MSASRPEALKFPAADPGASAVSERGRFKGRCTETFPIDRFRELMGVPPGKLIRGNDLVRWVIETAGLEVNGLSDCSVQIEPVRRNARAPITAVTITWWRKEGEAYRQTLRELRQPKVGRMARLKGTVEAVTASPALETQ